MKACLKNPTKYFSPDEIKLVKDFINLLQQELLLKNDVHIDFDPKKDVHHPNWFIDYFDEARALVQNNLNVKVNLNNLVC